MTDRTTDRILDARLEAAARRLRSVRLGRRLLIVSATAAILAGLLWLAGAGPGGMIVVAAVGLPVAVWAMRWTGNAIPATEAAAAVEARYPELDASLQTAVELTPEDGRFGFLQREVLDAARRHSRANDWAGIVSPLRIASLYGGSLLLLALAAIFAAQLRSSPVAASVPPQRLANDPPAAEWVIEPGDIELERGSSLRVLARLNPASAGVLVADDGQAIREWPMTPVLGEDAITARVDAVDANLSYRVRIGQTASRPYRVTVFERPQLIRFDAVIRSPVYLDTPPQTLQDVRRLTVRLGSEIELTATVNKPVSSARLLTADGPAVELRPTEAATCTARLSPRKSVRYTLELIDADGRRAAEPATLRIDVVANAAPSIRLTRPGRDVDLSPIEEFDFAADVQDDAGLLAAGWEYQVIGSEPVATQLLTASPGESRQTLTASLRLEELGVAPDDLIVYHFWADDLDDAGQPRRTRSDLSLVTVRPFERIYRQAEDAPRQPPSAGEQASTELVKLQKQVIDAAWKVIRQSQTEPADTLADDAATLAEAETLVIAKLDRALAESISDPVARRFALQAREAMVATAGHFRKATQVGTIDEVRSGLATAQQAYRLLLKLRTREVVIQRQQSPGTGSPGGQQDTSNLELNDDRNRYETQSQAMAAEQAAAAEDRQMLSRLRDLARRQSDLRERITQTQAAIEAARTPEEQAEAERQLQRLQAQQQQLVRDAEELQQRMQSQSNRSRTAAQRPQMQSARESIRQAAEALRDRELSRAAAESRRAADTLDQLQDELQKRSATAYAEAIDRLQGQAEEAIREQAKLRDESGPADGPATLRSAASDPADDTLAEAIREQRERVEALTESMRTLITDAEADQPLLADKLYEAIRQTRAMPPERALEVMEQATRRQRPDLQRQAEQAAADGLQTLRAGIEQAARSVVDDEVEALRQAKQKLQQLRNEASGEASNRPKKSEGEGQPDAPSGNAGDGSGGQPGAETGETGDATEADASGRPTDRSDRQPSQRSSGRQSGRSSPTGRGQGLGRGGDARSPFRGPTGRQGPLLGDDFRDWSDRLRDVEELLTDSELRSTAAGIRDQARDLRRQARDQAAIDRSRRSAQPSQSSEQLRRAIQTDVVEPLDRLARQVDRELLQRTGDELVPLDRVPVRPEYEPAVRDYYRRLGVGE